jgi:8-oxo-dGTP pyrophosphatase MutT (NUDIX family)
MALSNPTETQWLDDLQASINRVPLRPRTALRHGSQAFGSVDSRAFAEFVSGAGLADVLEYQCASDMQEAAWVISGDPGVALRHIAQSMRLADYARVADLWRDEQLAVNAAEGPRISTVERGAVRAFGISTQGVHLHGVGSDHQVWIQQRALDKQMDPGRWDTLMGGMVSAADSLESALAQETMEEAGLALEQLSGLHWAGHFTMRMPTEVDSGLGYMVERIDWFEAVVPVGVAPVNQDGEVHQFKLVAADALKAMLLQSVFTTEASLILASHFRKDCLSGQ